MPRYTNLYDMVIKAREEVSSGVVLYPTSDASDRAIGYAHFRVHYPLSAYEAESGIPWPYWITLTDVGRSLPTTDVERRIQEMFRTVHGRLDLLTCKLDIPVLEIGPSLTLWDLVLADQI